MLCIAALAFQSSVQQILVRNDPETLVRFLVGFIEATANSVVLAVTLKKHLLCESMNS